MYDDFINKCKLICEKNVKPASIQIKPKIIFKIKVKETEIKSNVVDVKTEKIVKEKAEQEKTQIVRGNKLSQEEKREKERLKKQKQREALREKYGDEGFKKMRAEEIARTRQKKKLNEEAKLNKKGLSKSSVSFIAAISQIEENLYQVRNQSSQDPLNFPIKLNNKLASLMRVVESGDYKPTDGSYKVFDELKAELAIEIKQLNKLLAQAKM